MSYGYREPSNRIKFSAPGAALIAKCAPDPRHSNGADLDAMFGRYAEPSRSVAGVRSEFAAGAVGRRSARTAGPVSVPRYRGFAVPNAENAINAVIPTAGGVLPPAACLLALTASLA